MSSTTPSASGITISGISSGLDTNSIITQLIAIQKVPITNLQNKATTLQTQQTALSNLEGYLGALSATAGTLSNSQSFLNTTANLSDSTVATVTTSQGSTAGTYKLTVSQLATAQKVASAAQSGSTTALNLTGTFVVSGVGVSVTASDSLQDIATKINSTGASVTASVVSGGTGSAYLTVASNTTGAANGVSLSDVSGSVLSGLGMTTSTEAVRSPITNGASSNSFKSTTNSISSQLSLSSSIDPNGSFTINGTSIAVDYNTDTIQSVADKINASGSGATAAVVPTTTNGVTTYNLQISGTSSTPTFGDSSNLLSSIGVLQNSYGNQLVGANDAAYSVDGLNLTSSTNQITTAIPNATLTLLKGSPTSPSSTTVTLASDTSGIVANVSSFVSAYNAVADYITSETSFDASTYATGTLFGDYTTQLVDSTLKGMIFSNVPGLNSSYNNLAELGLSFNGTGDLQLDSTALTSALNSDSSSVAKLFGSSGTTTSSDLTFVSSSSDTVSNGNPYSISISQPATLSTFTGSQPYPSPSTASENLTFGGTAFGSSGYTINVPPGQTLSQTINQINSDSTLKNQVTASSDSNGDLVITSKKYGAGGNFTLSSDINSSLGNTVEGLDVAGTINGEAATGTGQFLMGNTGNATTSGLQVQYTGNSTGTIGSMTFSKGIADQVSDSITSLIDSNNGPITAESNSIQSQISDINDQVTNLNTQLTAQEQTLKNTYAQMEAAIAQSKSQLSAINSFAGQQSSSSSSTSNGFGTVSSG